MHCALTLFFGHIDADKLPSGGRIHKVSFRRASWEVPLPTDLIKMRILEKKSLSEEEAKLVFFPDPTLPAPHNTISHKLKSARTLRGLTPLMMAAAASKRSKEMCQALLSAKAEVGFGSANVLL